MILTFSLPILQHYHIHQNAPVTHHPTFCPATHLPSAHSNSVLTFPNNIYIVKCKIAYLKGAKHRCQNYFFLVIIFR